MTAAVILRPRMLGTAVTKPDFGKLVMAEAPRVLDTVTKFSVFKAQGIGRIFMAAAPRLANG
jgi:hypothetical protein